MDGNVRLEQDLANPGIPQRKRRRSRRIWSTRRKSGRKRWRGKDRGDNGREEDGGKERGGGGGKQEQDGGGGGEDEVSVLPNFLKFIFENYCVHVS
jgi:hypothetical protein